jgi:hypothetical protein
MTYYLRVYVPRPHQPEVGHIDVGAAVVGLPLDDGRVEIH